MATVSTIRVSDTTSFLVVATDGFPTPTKSILLNTIQSTNIGKIIYVKEITGLGSPFFLSTSSTNTIVGPFSQRFSSIRISSFEAYTIQAQTSTSWAVLGSFQNIGQFPQNLNPPSAPLTSIVQPLVDTSCLFVDLRTQSKTLVLPPLPSLSWSNRVSPFLSIKDVYGNAINSTLYISTNLNDSFEGGRSNIALLNSFASVDLVGNNSNRVWNIVGYYSGTKVV
jgi:hypothetical protein